MKILRNLYQAIRHFTCGVTTGHSWLSNPKSYCMFCGKTKRSMTMRNIIGLGMFAVPFILACTVLVMTLGWLALLITVTSGLVISAWICIALCLISEI